MEFCLGLHQPRGSKISTSWTTLIFLYSTLCMWTSVECWSYYYSNTTMNWGDAERWCKTYYTNMVAIQNQEEIAHLNSWLPKKDTYYWIGIRKTHGVWTWVGTKKALTPEATNWAEGEPNNGKSGRIGGKNEDCVEMYVKRDLQPGKWNDERCTKPKTALCYAAACKNDSCVHGECVETINSHKCECFEGFHGEKCEHVVQCEKDKVTIPEKASNVTCSDKYGNFSYDSVCQYHCEEGYQPTLSGAMRCTASGNWTEQPTCELVQCKSLSSPERGFMNCSDPLGSSSFQSTCVFSCEEGYILDGSNSTSLQCKASGQWNDTQPRCVAVQCPALQVLESGTVSCSDDEDTRFSYGNVCSFSCARGYRLVGPSTVTCTSMAKWSEEMPRCEAIICQKPEGTHLIAQCNLPLNELRPESTCSFSCDAGFELQGAPAIQCSENGEWNTDIPTCKAIICQKPEGTHLIAQCNLPLNELRPESTCSFSCDAGFELQGAPAIQCSENGEWNTDIPTCKAIICQKPEGTHLIAQCNLPLNELRTESTCSFSCDAGFELQGAPAIQCSENGEWNADIPTCKALQCPPSAAPVGGQIMCGSPMLSSPASAGNPHTQGTVCTFRCDDGYELQGSRSMECALSGQWTSTPPTCTAVTCPLPEAPVNGGINCSDAELKYKSECSFTCNEGHLLHGHEVVSCSHHGNWTQETPICKAPPAFLQTPTAKALAAGGAVSVSGLSMALWLLKKLKRKGNKFELSSSSDLEAVPQSYRNSTDSLI